MNFLYKDKCLFLAVILTSTMESMGPFINDSYYKDDLNIYYDSVFSMSDATRFDFIAYYCEKTDKISTAAKGNDPKSTIYYKQTQYV